MYGTILPEITPALCYQSQNLFSLAVYTLADGEENPNHEACVCQQVDGESGECNTRKGFVVLAEQHVGRN